MNNLPPAGWYPDQNTPGRSRYWDGARWADPEPGTQPMPVFAPTPPGPSRADGAQWWKRTWVIAVGAGLLGLMIGAAGSSGDDTKEAASDTAAPTVTVTAEPTATATVIETATETPKPARTKSAAAPKAATGSSEGPYIMPNEVGKSLQGAQDDLQEVSGNPFFFSYSEDATGEGRMQVLDSGWQVCSQEPAAGEPFGEDTIVTFFVVRESETCP